ncbi:MAG: hypothetical protein GEU74_14235, partial [Nitriliruptorales bacterium]|nr:hypothetical protein [Nitriliruptorales bacterium]
MIEYLTKKGPLRVCYVLAPLLALLPACAADEGPVEAGTYPSRPVEMIVQSSPGGGWDAVSRAVAEALPRHLEGADDIPVANRTGGGGAEQFELVVSDPTGHTVGPLALPGLVGASAAGLEIDLSRAQVLGSVSEEPYVLVASRASGLTSIEDLAARDSVLVGNSQSVSGGDYFTNVLLSSHLGT